MKRDVVGRWGLLALVGAGLFALYRTSPAESWDRAFVVKGAPLVVGDGTVARVELVPTTTTASTALALDVITDGDDIVTRVRLTESGTLHVHGAPKTAVIHRTLHVVPRGYVVIAAVLVLALAVLLPYAFRTPGTALGPWEALLTEPGGGYSLARVQLLLWFLPVAVLYAALSIVSRSFAPIDTQLTILLGLSGVTGTLGAATSPPLADTPIGVPRLTDVVHDWTDRGDITRYQYVLLSLVGACVLIIGFAQHLEFPHLPSQFLYLVAASQGTYLATKAVKAAQVADAGAAGARSASAAPVPAPAVLSPGPPAPPGPVAGSFTPR